MTLKSQQEIINKLLAARGIKNRRQREDFLNPKYSQLGDPMLLPDIAIAISRIKEARSKNEKVYIYGDYDVDGITATTLLLDALNSFGISASYYMPDRFAEGYGMSASGVRAIAEAGGSLIITVDCGSRSVDEIALASELSIDVIVTDHHSLGDKLPECIAVINPKRKDSNYAFNDLAGVGVAFTLVRALQGELKGLEPGQEKWLLDLVALGTTCDIVSMTGENRILVKWGLEVARKSRRYGFDALSVVSSVDKLTLNTEDFGYRFGPRLNAAGRLESAELSLKLMLASNAAEATSVAQKLDKQNSLRRSAQSKIFKEASLVADGTTDPVIIASDKDWSHGVVGIVAAKIVEKYKKPAFIMQEIGDETKGSARSFGDFHLANAIDAARDTIITGGGHALAAGVTLKTEKLEEFKQAINKYYEGLKLGDQAQLLEQRADADLIDLSVVSLEFIKETEKFQPFGKDNEPPLFRANVNILEYKKVGADRSHLRLTVTDDKGNKFVAIGFGLAENYDVNTVEAEIIFEIQKNEFNGNVSPQLVLKHLKTKPKK